MIEETLLNLVSTVGFPIVITFYLLFRFEKKLNQNTEVMMELIETLRDKRTRKNGRRK